MAQHAPYDSDVPESRDHYKVLGLSPDADADEIRQAYRRLVHVLHPDRHYEATPAERALADRRMREINEAWNTLRDPARRRNYDSSADLGNGHRKGSGGSGSAGTRPAPRGQRPTASTRASGRSSTNFSTGPGSSSSAGNGAYWRLNGTGRPGGQSGGSPAGAQDDGIAVTPGVAFLLKRGPIVVIVALVLGLFIVTAYVGGGGETRQVQPPPLDACARVIDGSTAVLVPCSMPNDGAIVAQVDAALDCPSEASRYVTVGTDFYCIPTAEQHTEGE